MPHNRNILILFFITLLNLIFVRGRIKNEDILSLNNEISGDRNFQKIPDWSFLRSLTDQSESCNTPSLDCVGTECTYCPFTNCWIREALDVYENVDCDQKNPIAEFCPDLKDPSPVAKCPSNMTWTPPSTQIKQGENSMFHVEVDFAELYEDLIESPCRGKRDSGSGKIPHANVHACVKQSTDWWCTELVPAYQPKIVKTSPALCLTPELSSENRIFQHEFPLEISVSSLLVPNEWVIYAHIYFYTNKSGILQKYHFTTGNTFLVQGKELVPSSTAMAAVYFCVGITCFISLLTLFLLIFWRENWIIKASSLHMCILMALSGFLGAVSMFSWIPVWLNTHWCQARVWLIPIAVDLLILPLALKTWRVYVIFKNNAKMRRVKITNNFLLYWVSGVLLFEIIYNLIWTLTAPLYVGKVYSSLDPNAFNFECVSSNETAQMAFTIVSIILHFIPCIVLAVYAHKVRLSFKYDEWNKKHAEFDESLFIMLAVMNLAVTAMFVIAFQYSLNSEPSAVTIMRVGGTAWIVCWTLFLLFFPKFLKIMKWDVSKPPPRLSSYSSSFHETVERLTRASANNIEEEDPHKVKVVASAGETNNIGTATSLNKV